MADTFLAIIGAEFFILAIAIIWGIIKLLGGWPEAHYRVWGIPYFRQGIFEEDGSLNTWIIRTDKIHHSVPSFKNAEGEWMIDAENDSRYHGRPSRYWNRGDAQQIPFKKWRQIIPEDYTNEKGETIKANSDRWLPIDPELIKAAYDDDSIERARTIGRKLPFPNIYILLAVLVACIIAGVAVYYSHETLCAVKPMVC